MLDPLDPWRARLGEPSGNVEATIAFSEPSSRNGKSEAVLRPVSSGRKWMPSTAILPLNVRLTAHYGSGRENLIQLVRTGDHIIGRDTQSSSIGAFCMPVQICALPADWVMCTFLLFQITS